MQFLKRMKIYFLKKKIKNSLVFFSITLLIFNLAFIGFFTYNTGSATITQWILKTNQQVLKQTLESTGLLFNKIQVSVNEVFGMADLWKYLDVSYDEDSKKYLENYDFVRRKIANLMNIRDEIIGVEIFCDNGILISNDHSVKFKQIDSNRLKNKLIQTPKSVLWTYQLNGVYEGDFKKYLVMCKSIVNGNGEYKGFIMVFLDPRVIDEIFVNISNSNVNIFLADENNEIIYSNDQKQIGTKMMTDYTVNNDSISVITDINKTKYLISSNTDTYTGSNLYFVQPYNKAFNDFLKLRWWLFLTIALCIIVFILLEVSISLFFTHKIDRLNSAIDTVMNENNISSFGDNSRNPLKHKSLYSYVRFKTKLAFILAFLIILPSTIVMLVCYFTTLQLVETKAMEVNKLNIQQIVKRIEYNMRDVEKNVYNIYWDNSVMNILRNVSFKGERVRDDEKKIILDSIDSIKRKSKYIKDIAFYIPGQSGDICFSTKDETALYKKLNQDYLNKLNNSSSQWFFKDENSISNSNIYLVKKIMDPDERVKTLAYIFFYVDENSFDDILGSTDLSSEYSFVIDENRYMLLHFKKKLIGKKADYDYLDNVFAKTSGASIVKREYDSVIISFETLMNVGWKVINVSSIENMMANMNRIIYYYLFLLIFSGCISVYLISKIAGNIGNRIGVLSSKVQGFASENDICRHEDRIVDEIDMLDVNFAKMMDRIRFLINDVYKERIKKNEAEIAVLQEQINPHFIYNTLEVIRCKSVLLFNGKNEIEDIVLALSEFFRISLNNGNAIIKISDEIQHAKNYLKIMKHRYFKEFTITWHVQSEALINTIPKIILQPLLENAIFHGIKPLSADGAIDIYIYKYEGLITIIVTDNGIGMMKDTLENLVASMNELSDTGSGKQKKGFGLKNINRRIKIYYGNEFGLFVNSIEDEGTVALIRIPER